MFYNFRRPCRKRMDFFNALRYSYINFESYCRLPFFFFSLEPRAFRVETKIPYFCSLSLHIIQQLNVACRSAFLNCIISIISFLTVIEKSIGTTIFELIEIIWSKFKPWRFLYWGSLERCWPTLSYQAIGTVLLIAGYHLKNTIVVVQPRRVWSAIYREQIK